jgi:hypothetical protein
MRGICGLGRRHPGLQRERVLYFGLDIAILFKSDAHAWASAAMPMVSVTVAGNGEHVQLLYAPHHNLRLRDQALQTSIS